MRIYKRFPKPKRAKRMWVYFQNIYPSMKIIKLYKMSNCWRRPVLGKLWGCWVCEYKNGKVEIKHPRNDVRWF